MNIADLIKERRAELGLTQADLATQVGIDKRQVRRYEAGEVQPTLSVAAAIARALNMSLDELAGESAPRRVDLAGDWWASWQTSKDGVEVITAQEVRISQRADHIDIQTTTRGIAVEDGGYHWRGELRLWDNEILMGWYSAAEGGVRSKGTMYFVLHPHGVNMRGRWVGLSYDGKVQTGWGGIGKSDEDARGVIEELKQDESAS
jgi:transcriptional regulator with XRE-family HTH domain